MKSNATEELGPIFYAVEPVVVYSQMVIAAVTVPFYVVVIFVLIRNRRRSEMAGVFFQIYTIGGFIDIIALLNNVFLSIFPSQGWFIEFYLASAVYAKVFLIVSWGSRLNQGCTVLLLAITRTMAVLSPLTHEQFWVGKRLRVAGSEILPGVALGSSILFTGIHWELKQNAEYYPSFTDAAFKLRLYIAAFSIQFLLCCAIIANYAFVLWFFRNRRKALLPVKSNDRQRTEHRLLKMSIVVCSLEVIGFIFTIYAYALRIGIMSFYTLPTPAFYLVQNSMITLYSSAPPYLLVAFSTPFKRRLLGLFGHHPTSRTAPLMTHSRVDISITVRTVSTFHPRQ